MEVNKLRWFTNKILKMVNEDVEFDFTEGGNYIYVEEKDKVYIPLNTNIKDVNRHHIYWIKTHYNLDIQNNNYPLELTYHILSLFHEIGHRQLCNSENFNSKADMEVRLMYIVYVCQNGDNFDMYRNDIPSEKLADMYSVKLWREYEEDILKFLDKYSKYLVDK